MNTICGADCTNCSLKTNCSGCAATCGSPFGGKCTAAGYIKEYGKEKYAEFKEDLLAEINALLKANDIPETDALYELAGFLVNLPYLLPSGETVKFLDDRNIYIGAQIRSAEQERCFGVIADTSFIMICSFAENGTDPELIMYRKR